MLLIECNRNTPLKARTGYAEIFQARFDEVVDHLIDTGLRLEEVSLLIEEQCFELIGESRELKEVSLFLCIDDFTSAVRALAVFELAFCPERLTRRAVLADVLTLIDISFIVESLKDVLYRLYVIRISGSDKTVICDIEALPELLEVGNDVTPASCAFFSIFWPCSSVPVKNMTS